MSKFLDRAKLAAGSFAFPAALLISLSFVTVGNAAVVPGSLAISHSAVALADVPAAGAVDADVAASFRPGFNPFFRPRFNPFFNRPFFNRPFFNRPFFNPFFDDDFFFDDDDFFFDDDD